MSDSARTAYPDPGQLYAQWYDATFGPWSEALRAGSAVLDPLGIYRQWLDDLQGARPPGGGTAAGDGSAGGRDGAAGAAASTGGADSVTGVGSGEFARQLVEASGETWRRAAEISAVLVRLTPRWVELSDEVRKQLLQDGLPTDPLDAAVRWYNITSGPLSDMIRELLSNEAYLESSRRALENYATLETVFRRASEDFFGRLQLSTSSDSARIAALVVALDDKVDRLEDTLEEYADADAAAAKAVERRAVDSSGAESSGPDAELREQLRRVEDKLDRLLAAPSPATTGLGWAEGEGKGKWRRRGNSG